MSRANSQLGNTTELGSHGGFIAEYGKTALKFYLLSIARELLPNERIQVCWRYPLPGRTCIEIIYSEELKRARSAGTMKCGSGWVCPACMSYIQERRRKELALALERSKDDYFSILITYTAAHTKKDRLADVLSGLQSAFRTVKTGRMWQLIREEYMLAGSVRATEITFGENGWHPHYHELMLVNRELLSVTENQTIDDYCQSLQRQLTPRFLTGLERVGMSGKDGIAVDVRGANKEIAAYIAKFGKQPKKANVHVNPYEVAYSTSKTARNGNLGVLDILFLAGDSAHYGNLYKEYHAATKGKSMLQWSRGLKKLLDIEVLRDEIAAEGIETETDVVLAEIDVSLWRWIAIGGHLAQVMTYAALGDKEKLSTLLLKIAEKYADKAIPNKTLSWQLGH